MLRIIFAGTPPIAATVLSAILKTPHQVVAVLTQPDRPAGRGRKLQASAVKEVAQANELPIYQPTSLKENHQIIEMLAAYNADAIIVLGYGLLLPPEVISLTRLGCINYHVSLLPRWRGASPITQAILHGDQKSGISIMQIDQGLDSGPILAQFQCDITKEETTESLTEKLALLGAQQTAFVLDSLEKNELTPVAQDTTKVTYAKKITKEEAQIDWHLSAAEIAYKVRAFNPWPVAFSHYNDLVIRIWSAYPLMEKTTAAPGTLIKKSETGFDVATADGILRLTEVQLPGKSRIQCSELFKTAHPLFQEQGLFT
jgi:methionyl-tRNA formyltransferase